MKSGLSATNPVWTEMTAETALKVVDGLTRIADMPRAPELASFDDETSSCGILRRKDFLNHVSISFERSKELYGDEAGDDGDDDAGSSAATSASSGERKKSRNAPYCVMCAELEGSRSRRASGRCLVCRVALCEEHFSVFHVVDRVRSSRKKPLLDWSSKTAKESPPCT